MKLTAWKARNQRASVWRMINGSIDGFGIGRYAVHGGEEANYCQLRTHDILRNDIDSRSVKNPDQRNNS